MNLLIQLHPHLCNINTGDSSWAFQYLLIFPDSNIFKNEQDGKEKFTLNGFIYAFDAFSKSDNSVKFWRCEKRQLCKARIHTRNGEMIKEINTHSHDSSAVDVEVAQVVTKVKKRAEETIEGTIQVINECLTNTSQAAQARLPNSGALRKLVRRKRNEVRAAPPNPMNLDQLLLPDAYKIYEVQPGIEENFLLADSEEGPNRILIFGRRSWLQHLQTCNTWYADGTFSITPPLFSQVYTVMAVKNNGVHPIFYALLPNKQWAAYHRMFELIKELIPNLQPAAIHCDFEQAAFTAMKDCFPGVNINGCVFHLAQNMRKHLGTMELLREYNNDPQFALCARMVTSLAFVPIANLDDAIDVLANYLPPELQPLLDWFEDNYVGRMNRRGNGRRLPLFPLEMWNLHERTFNGQDRTNNQAQAAHRRLQMELGMNHPTIWKFIDALRKVQKGRDTYYEQLVAGNPPPLKLKKYRDADDRILSLVQNFEGNDILEYLRGLAHNYEM